MGGGFCSELSESQLALILNSSSQDDCSSSQTFLLRTQPLEACCGWLRPVRICDTLCGFLRLKSSSVNASDSSPFYAQTRHPHGDLCFTLHHPVLEGTWKVEGERSESRYRKRQVGMMVMWELTWLARKRGFWKQCAGGRRLVQVQFPRTKMGLGHCERET